MKFKTASKVPKVGVMFVGLGGNNGSTAVAGMLANKHNVTWETKEGTQKPNYWGSVMMSSTVKVGHDAQGRSVHAPMQSLLPMVHPNDLAVTGWDISKMPLGDAMRRSQVLDIDLQNKLYDRMNKITPLPSIYFPDFIAANQSDRADNVLTGTKQEQTDEIRKNIRDFKKDNKLDKVIVLWTANTERFAEVRVGLNDTADNMLKSIKNGEAEGEQGGSLFAPLPFFLPLLAF